MTRPVLECCTPYGVPMPSGWKWAHSRRCPRYPGQLVGRERTPERIAVVKARLAHPASFEDEVTHGIGSTEAVRIWNEHRNAPPGHQCWACTYTDAWLDRDDEEYMDV